MFELRFVRFLATILNIVGLLYLGSVGSAQIYWFLFGSLILLFCAGFLRRYFSLSFLSNQHEICKRYSKRSQVYCYDFSKSSIMFFRIYLDPYTFERQKAVSAHL